MRDSNPLGRAHAWTHRREAFRLFCRGVTVPTAGRTAVVVGTLLSLVNQGAVLWSGEATAVTWLQVLVNFAVPFTVASVGFLAACRVPQPPSGGGEAGARSA